MADISSIFTPEEHRVLATWLGVDPQGPVHDGERLEVVLARLGFTSGSLDEGLAAAVAAIVQGTVAKRLPNVVTQRRVNGSWEPVSSQDLRQHYPKKVTLFPRHLLTVSWRDTARCKKTACAYHATWLPLYGVHVITARYEAADAKGHQEIALGAPQETGDVWREAREVVMGHWRRLNLDGGLPRWNALWATGLLGRSDADRMAEGVWG